jgi:sialate O-acetylesterase
MKALVQGWRSTWGQGDFPFYLVQLANFRAPNTVPAGGDGYARLREAQLKTMREVPKTGMAVIIDIGEAGDIHPQNKFDVGHRLALWALAKDYGKQDLVHSGPIYKEMKVEDGKIRVLFEHTGSGLMAAKKESPQSNKPPQVVEKLESFAIAGEDKKWVWANAIIDGDTVVVSSPEVENPVAVRYAFSMNPAKANLYNKEGLPASPFRTDTW